MRVELEPGKYVIAVSGGVDSMTLLHRLRAEPGIALTVAHLDHGMRADSAEDLQLVERTARQYGLPFVSQSLELGEGTSEARARTARYAFLHEVRRECGARAIITAHHQDDLLETAIINLLRGTGRRGLTALGNRKYVRRPLLKVSKQEVRAYAAAHDVVWHEDSTNQDDAYLRNYIRHHVLPRLDIRARQRLLRLIGDLQTTNSQIDALLANYLAVQSKHGQLDRGRFIQLPHAAARETLAAWLRAGEVRDFDSPALERLVIMAKTARPGSRHDVRQGVRLHVSRAYLALDGSER